MVLCIDVGNTNAVMGMYDDGKLIKNYRSNKITKSNFLNFLDGIDYENKVNKVMISSVNINVNDDVTNIIKEVLNIDPIFIKYNSNLGLVNKLKAPEELGADLLIGGFAATIKYGVPNIVFDMGTANTVFVVNEKKEIMGGIIMPGTIISFKELMNKASLLKDASFLKPEKIIGGDTNEAIGSGIFYGNAILIDGFVERIKKELNKNDIKVIITGGMANIIYPYLENKYIHDDMLLLDGLYEASKIL